MKLFALEETVHDIVENDVAIEDSIDTTDIYEEEHTISSSLDNISESLEDYSTLTSIKNHISNNTLDYASASITKIATESICNRLGVDKVQYLYCLENYKSSIAKTDTTKLALEEIKDKLQAIGKKIADAIRAIFDKLKMFWYKVTDVFERKLKALKSLESSIKELKGSPRDKTFIGSNRLKSLFNVSEANLDTFMTYTKTYTELSNFSINITSFLIGVDLDKIKNIPNETKEFELLGGKTLSYGIRHDTDNKEDVNDSANHSYIPNVTIKDTVEGSENVEVIQLNVLTTSDMKTLISATTKMLKEVNKVTDKFNAVNTSIQSRLKTLDSLIAKGKDDQEDNNDHAILKDFKSAVANLSKLLTPAIYSNALKLVDVNIEYVKQSMKMYK